MVLAFRYLIMEGVERKSVCQWMNSYEKEGLLKLKTDRNGLKVAYFNESYVVMIVI